MTYSRAYESYSENPNFTDHSGFREPVEGTVPRGYAPLPYTKDLEDRDRAGREQFNPVASTDANVITSYSIHYTKLYDEMPLLIKYPAIRDTMKKLWTSLANYPPKNDPEAAKAVGTLVRRDPDFV